MDTPVKPLGVRNRYDKKGQKQYALGKMYDHVRCARPKHLFGQTHITKTLLQGTFFRKSGPQSTAAKKAETMRSIMEDILKERERLKETGEPLEWPKTALDVWKEIRETLPERSDKKYKLFDESVDNCIDVSDGEWDATDIYVKKRKRG